MKNNLIFKLNSYLFNIYLNNLIFKFKIQGTNGTSEKTQRKGEE